jgi:predicted mannosyl-3-phosphoglycerate phosphatase (HAD superfamily)
MSIGLGDGLNDAPLLEVVDHPIIVRSPSVATLQSLLPHAPVTLLEGPEGWNEAILGLLRDPGMLSAIEQNVHSRAMSS